MLDGFIALLTALQSSRKCGESLSESQLADQQNGSVSVNSEGSWEEQKR